MEPNQEIPCILWNQIKKSPVFYGTKWFITIFIFQFNLFYFLIVFIFLIITMLTTAHDFSTSSGW